MTIVFAEILKFIYTLILKGFFLKLQSNLIRRFTYTNGTFGAADEAKVAYKGGIIAAASAARSIGPDSRSWIIDGQVHTLVQLPHATRVRQSVGQSRPRLFAIAAAAIS